jgi:hypothetical protein
MNARSRKRLVDGLVEAYVEWRESCDRVNDAYRGWTRETGTSGRVAFALYMGALNAEEQAAEAYAGLIRRAGKPSWSEQPTAAPLGDAGWGVDWP